MRCPSRGLESQPVFVPNNMARLPISRETIALLEESRKQETNEMVHDADIRCVSISVYERDYGNNTTIM
jgi:hypothetical protein